MLSIDPTAIVGPEVQLGKDVYIGPYSVIRSKVIIGDGTHIASFVSIGEEAEHSTDKYELNKRDYCGKIIIGSGVIIREFTTINRPVNTQTFVGDNVYVMARVHIPHDCYLEEDSVISNNAIMGGFTKVLKGATLGICAATHQFTTIGQYAMIAANATVVKDIPPLAKFIPNKELDVNTYAIKKWNLPLPGTSFSDIMKLDYYQSLMSDFRSKRDSNRPVYFVKES